MLGAVGVMRHCASVFHKLIVIIFFIPLLCFRCDVHRNTVALQACSAVTYKVLLCIRGDLLVVGEASIKLCTNNNRSVLLVYVFGAAHTPLVPLADASHSPEHS